MGRTRMKCPTCNSSKTAQNKDYFTCLKCGYINKKVNKKNSNNDKPKKETSTD